MPLLFGANVNVGESHANRQWEVHVAGIKSIQHLLEFVLERAGNIVMQVQGIQAVTRFRFAELRAAELLRDAQVEWLQIQNAARKRDEGWITQDEAAQAVVGHKAVSETPLVSGTNDGTGGGLVGANADPGSQRSAQYDGHGHITAKVLENILPPVVPTQPAAATP